MCPNDRRLRHFGFAVPFRRYLACSHRAQAGERAAKPASVAGVPLISANSVAARLTATACYPENSIPLGGYQGYLTMPLWPRIALFALAALASGPTDEIDRLRRVFQKCTWLYLVHFFRFVDERSEVERALAGALQGDIALRSALRI